MCTAVPTHWLRPRNPSPSPAFGLIYEVAVGRPRSVLRIRIHRIHMFLGLLDPDPDPSVRGIHRIHMFLGLLDLDPDPDLDPSITKQKK
jgi:hypothetical protein